MRDLPIGKLRALYLAEIHMREAGEASAHLAKLENPSTTLSHCLYTGIVISYSRSFGQNNGISSIGSEFRKFEDPKQQGLHDALLHARDTIYAHRDFIKERERISADLSGEALDNIEIDISQEGKTHWILVRPNLQIQYLADIVKLCDFQIDRLRAASSNMLMHFCKGTIFTPGRYILGQTFP